MADFDAIYEDPGGSADAGNNPSGPFLSAQPSADSPVVAEGPAVLVPDPVVIRGGGNITG